MKNKLKRNERFRIITQAISFAFHNGYIKGWINGKIHTGVSKALCVPGLNCYSCPGAFGACPIGSLQAVMGDAGYKISLYVLGFIGMVGILCGRLICGWLCPFGFIQDLLHRIPLFKKTKTLPGHKYLKYLKYLILMLFVIILPLCVTNVAGIGDPWFCEWICPSGTLLGGIPNIIANENLRSGLGIHFIIKVVILLAVIIGSIKIPRPFCKYLCPLGAMYGLCNPVSTYRLKVDADKCVSCGACRNVCPMDIETYKTPNSLECIRCGKCMVVCPSEAITSTWGNLIKGNKAEIIPKISKKQIIKRISAGVIAAVGGGMAAFFGLYMLMMYVSGGYVFSVFQFVVSALPFALGLAASIFPLVLSARIFINLNRIEKTEELKQFARITLAAAPIICVAAVLIMQLLIYFGQYGFVPQVLLAAGAGGLLGLIHLAFIEVGTAIALVLLSEKKSGEKDTQGEN